MIEKREGAPITSSFLDAFINSKDRLRILERAVESTRNGIVITDPNLPDNPIVYVNKAFLDMSGFSLEEILGQNCRFLQGPDRDQPELLAIRQALKEGQASLALLRNYRKDGTLFWNELSISPVYDDSGKLINFIGVQNDVTARKEAERRVSEFHSMVSHELRTPLSSIRASLGLVTDGEAGVVPPKSMRLLTIALNNADRLLKLVDDILDIKRMEAGKLTLDFTIVNPEEVVNEVIGGLAHVAAQATVSIQKHMESKKTFCADHARVVQVLTNLIANAIKFSPPAKPVTVTVSQIHGYVHFAVSDNGPGISDIDKEKLFVKFQQLDSSDTRAHSGSGLGLAISKMIVELHGGEIGVDSAVGCGSTFWFSLPLVPA